MTNITEAFVAQSRAYLTTDYLPKIHSAVERLDEDAIWWKPNPQSNSIGNLLLHLAGNVRQWVASGLGGAPDRRERALEFDPESRPSRLELLENLAAAVREADDALAGMPLEVLDERRTIQGHDVNCFEALYHAVEHFSMHTGQILYIVKLKTSEDLGFYKVVDGVANAQWNNLPSEDV